jgi:hypothetical protein
MPTYPQMRAEPPIREPLTDKDGRLTRPWVAWFQGQYKKLGGATDTAPISVLGSAVSITGEIDPGQLTPPIAVATGGTGAVDAPTARTNLSAQRAIVGSASEKLAVWDATESDFIGKTLADAGIVPASNIKFGRQSLNQPATANAGDFADTAFTWSSAFPDNNYTVLSALESTKRGALTILNKVAAGFDVRLTNVTAEKADGTAHLLGVKDP